MLFETDYKDVQSGDLQGVEVHCQAKGILVFDRFFCINYIKIKFQIDYSLYKARVVKLFVQLVTY